MKTVTRDCGHTDWADMLRAPCLECRMQAILTAATATLRSAAGVVLLDAPRPGAPLPHVGVVLNTARPVRAEEE